MRPVDDADTILRAWVVAAVLAVTVIVLGAIILHELWVTLA